MPVYNSLNGGAGNDYLRGLGGNDTLTGGPGNDIFLFNTAPNALTNRDTVADYNPAQDTHLAGERDLLQAARVGPSEPGILQGCGARAR